MLSIGKLVVGQQRYYEQQVAQGRDDYYSGRGEAPGEWVGAGARALGLEGRVGADQFNALIAGLDPRDRSKRLRDGPEPKVAALDLTFSAPKSVSVLYAVASEETAGELVGAHEAAVRASIGWLEDAAVQVRRGPGGHLKLPGQGLVAAAYRHRMSRALDPQLHTHVVAANMTCGPDGRFTALHAAPLYRAAKTAGYLYQAQLRAEVAERLGLEWGPVRKGAAELADIPREVVEEFSRRRHQMQRAAEEGGFSLATKRSAEAAAVDTRDRKQYGIDTHTWREEVVARAGEHGLDRAAVEKLIDRGQRRLDRGTGHESEPTSAVQQRGAPLDLEGLALRLVGERGLTERHNTFDERPVLQEFAQAASQGALVKEVRGWAQRFADRPDVLDTRGGEMTTADLVACERRLIDAAVGRAGEGCAVVTGATVDGALSGGHVSLTAEQREAVWTTAGAGHGVQVIQALAGTGKTLTAGVLRAVYELGGYRVIGLAPTGRGARELTDQAGIPAWTIDRFLIDVEQADDGLASGSVLVIDEAGMAPTRTTARVLELAAAAGVKVVAIGDPGQLPSVLAGGWLRAVGERVGAVRLTEVMRQRDPGERRALAALHDGVPRRYIGWAEQNDRIQVVAGDSLVDLAIERWLGAVAKYGPREAVMISRDNLTRDILNQQARSLREEQGQLGEQQTYGDVVVSAGDRVICRSNHAGLSVDNGTRGTIRAASGDGVVIETDSGLMRELPAGYVQDHVELAYCLTGHGMQGGTVEQAIVAAAPHDLTAGWSYTALSRARGRTDVVIGADPVSVSGEREEVAPAERQSPAIRVKVLEQVVGRMGVRDDEDLAVEQLRPAGHEDDRELRSARRATGGPSQERGATHLDTGEPGPTAARLGQLQSELDRLAGALAALPVRPLARLHELDAEERELAKHRAAHADQLAALAPPARRLRRGQDPDAGQRDYLQAALDLDDRALSELRARQTQLRKELGDPDQIRSERDGLERALTRTRSEYHAVRDELAERDVVTPSVWAVQALGGRPGDERQRKIWERAIREIAAYRLEHAISNPDAPLGEAPTDPDQRRDWQRANDKLGRAQRQLGHSQQRDPHDVGLSLD